MARILTGIQSTGKPHLGNILGAIQPLIELSKSPKNEAYAFIADFHSLTTIKNAQERREFVKSVAATWIACGFDVEKNVLYCQSDVPEVAELTWYLNCFTPFPMLANAHSFKDKSEKMHTVNAGLFTYPVLMAADIIGYDANFVPVGKDQKQHLEMTRDIAASFNHQYGDTFVLPEAKIDNNVKVIPGTDGQKMSKSYDNTIDVFLPEKQLKKNIGKIITDTTPLEEPKSTENDTVFALYKLLATKIQTEEMRHNYAAGGYGYGHAKQELLKVILENFKQERLLFDELMNNPEKLDKILQKGAKKARLTIDTVLQRVRQKLGFK